MRQPATPAGHTVKQQIERDKTGTDPDICTVVQTITPYKDSQGLYAKLIFHQRDTLANTHLICVSVGNCI